MKESKYLFGMVITMIMVGVSFGALTYKAEASKRIVFQECLRRAAEFDDNYICNCAEFVGKPDWCDDLNY